MIGKRLHMRIMELTRTRYDQLWFAILTTIILCLVLLFIDFSTFLSQNNGIRTLLEHVNSIIAIQDVCSGRYIYVHDLPSRFNDELIKNCGLLSRGVEMPSPDKPNLCQDVVNYGFGETIKNNEGVLSNQSWFVTNQFMADLIFHKRMKTYDCLTNDSSLASAIYVPYYVGLDVSRVLWESNITVRDSSGKDLVRLLARRPEWKRMWGRDHFVVSGRTSWDTRRHGDNASYWGTLFGFLPESQNMSILSIEAASWNNDIAIPYPTHFHPSTDSEVLQWQNKVREQKRPYLFSFTGGPRPNNEMSIRSKLIEDCKGSTSCKFFDCSSKMSICDNPVNVMRVFQQSVFCLQPPGDSYTRRSVFDSMLAGCIPVFFHPATVYTQYLWHLPKNGTEFSVYIPIPDVREWNVSLEHILKGFSEERISVMRQKVIKLIPNIIYAHPRNKMVSTHDAFDLAVKGVLERVDAVRKDIKEGRDPSVGFSDQNPFRFSFEMVSF